MATLDDAVPSGASAATDHDAPADPRRRDYLQIGAVAFAGVGVGVIALPLVNQMNPSADVLAQSTTEVDLSAIQPGQAIKTSFRKQPLFVRNLTPKEISEADAVPVGSLRDPQTLEERTKTGKKNWLITLGVCTHLGCVPIANEGDYAVVEGSAKHGGWFCPCHGSHYDTAGRIRKGPAPQNLAVPQYAYLSDTKIRIG